VLSSFFLIDYHVAIHAHYCSIDVAEHISGNWSTAMRRAHHQDAQCTCGMFAGSSDAKTTVHSSRSRSPPPPGVLLGCSLTVPRKQPTLRSMSIHSTRLHASGPPRMSTACRRRSHAHAGRHRIDGTWEPAAAKSTIGCFRKQTADDLGAAAVCGKSRPASMPRPTAAAGAAARNTAASSGTNPAQWLESQFYAALDEERGLAEEAQQPPARDGHHHKLLHQATWTLHVASRCWTHPMGSRSQVSRAPRVRPRWHRLTSTHCLRSDTAPVLWASSAHGKA